MDSSPAADRTIGRPGVDQHERAGAVGALGVARARSTPGRTAPPAGHRRCRRSAAPGRGTRRVGARDDPVGRAPPRAARARGTPNRSHSSADHCPASMSNSSVRDALEASVTCRAPAGHPRDQVGVHGARSQRPVRQPRPRSPGSLLGQPGQLGGGEVRVEPQPGQVGHPRLVPGLTQRVADAGPSAGPARRSRGGARPACARSQTTDGLPLVGDADGWLHRRSPGPASSAWPDAASVACQMSSGRCSTQPGSGKYCRNSAYPRPGRPRRRR